MEDALHAAQGNIERNVGKEHKAPEYNLPLVHAIRRLLIAIICQSARNKPFASVKLSFCAMLSRKSLHSGQRGAHPRDRRGKRYDETDEAERQRRAEDGWHDPDNFNSSLAGLTSTSQLVLFKTAYFDNREN